MSGRTVTVLALALGGLLAPGDRPPTPAIGVPSRAGGRAMDPASRITTPRPAEAPRAVARRPQAEEPPAGLSRDEWSQIRSAMESSSYHATRVARAGEEAALVAANRQQRYRTTFRRNGIEIASKPVPGQDWRLGISVTGFGYEGDVRPLPSAEPGAEKGRVEYRRGPVIEWYENRPAGLEQGFTIAEPETRCSQPLVLAMAVDTGLRVRVEDASAASFQDSAGRTRVRYAGLAAWDADGRPLASRLEASEGELRLLVEAGDARFPVTVDPTFVQEAKLEGHGDPVGVAGALAGYSVSVSGDTAVVGAPYDDTLVAVNAGSAYVFVRSGTVWSEQQKLLASDGAASDAFGNSVSVSGDTAVVGAPGDADLLLDRGSAYVFVRSGTVWSQQQKLVASDAEAFDHFGNSVSVSGDTAVVGAYQDDTAGGLDAGSAYVFVRSGTVWSQQQKAVASDGAAHDNFGISVSISGDTAVVGAYADDTVGGTDVGSAYVFVRSGTVWSEQQHLFASDGAASDQFGISVSVSGDTAVVGAPYDDTVGGTDDVGSAYVFVRSGTVWSEQQKVVASDGAVGDLFGTSVSVSGDTAVVGAYWDDTAGGGNAGSAYMFVRSGTVWSEQQKLLASDGRANDLFGISVSVSGDTAVVGAYFDDTAGGANAGSAYVFVRSGTVWSQQQKLVASDGGEAFDHFGNSVSVSGDTAVVGAYQDDTLGGTNAGSAYVFVKSGTVWSEQQKLVDSDGAANDFFGSSVSVSGDTAVVGAYGTPGGADTGSAYVFVRSGTVWSEQQKLVASDGRAGDRFGISVSVSGDTAVVGATPDDDPPLPGSAYVFVRSGTVWNEQQRLTVFGASAYAQVGMSVSVSGDTAVVGAPQDDTAGGANAGSAYVFVRSGAVWSQHQKLFASDGAVGDLFGISVSVSGDTAVVGAPQDDTAGGADAGSAYVFVRSGTVWSEQQKLTASDGAVVDYFGISVSVSGDTAVVGAPQDDTAGGANAGSAYVFVRSGTVWSEQQHLFASDGAAGDNFGSVSVSGDTAVVGANQDDTAGGVDAGSAYVFRVLSADLAVTKTDGVPGVAPGGGLTYTIAVANAGPDPVAGATVVDALPAALTCSTTCVGTGGATCTAGPFSGNINDTVGIPAGQSVTYTASCTVSPSATGTLTNTATVTAPPTVTDPNLANNSATDVDVIGVPPGALTATAQSSSSVLVQWTDPNAGETGFRVERSTNGTSFTPVQTVGPNVTSLLDNSGLSAATLYYYRVMAVTPPGDVPSNVATATTFPAAAAQVCSTRVSPDHAWARAVSVAHNGTQWAAAWYERKNGLSDEIYVQLLAQATGAPVGTPTRITVNDMSSRFPTLRWNGTHFGLLWSESLRDAAGNNKADYRFALLDASLNVGRGPVPLFTNTGTAPGFLNSSPAQPLVWDGTGWGVFVLEGTTSPLDLVYYRLDADGDRLAGPVNLTNTVGDWEYDVDVAWNGSVHGIAWVRQANTTFEVRFQRLQPNGTLLGSPTVVATAAAGDFFTHGGVVWDGTGWVVAWNDTASNGSTAVDLRKLNADGTTAGAVKRLSSLYDPDFPPGDQVPVHDEVPVLVTKPGGGYIAYTSSFLNTTNAYEIGRLEADLNGDPVGTRTVVSGSDSHNSLYERVATDGTSFLVAYHDHAGGTQELATLKLSPSGTVEAGPTALTTGHAPPETGSFFESSESPEVASLLGGFAAVWSEPTASGRRAYARLYDASGVLAATRFPLSASGLNGRPAVVGVGSSFAMAWRDATNQVRFARYDAAGTLIGSEVVVSSATGGAASAAVDWSGEQYGVAWIQGGSVRLRRLLPAGTPVGSETTIGTGAQGPGPQVQWVASGWALVWRSGGNLYFGRISPSGSVAVAPVQLTTSGAVGSNFHLVWNGTSLGLAWAENQPTDPPGVDLYATVLDTAGVKAFPNLLAVNTAYADSFPRLYWAGGEFRLAHSYGLGTLREQGFTATGSLTSARMLGWRGGQNGVVSNGTTAGLAWLDRGDVSFETTACLADATPPTCPSAIGSFDGQRVSLTWTAAADPESGIQAYLVRRDGSLLGEQNGATLALDDPGFISSTTHVYMVRAVNGASLESGGCAPVNVSTVPPADLSVTLADSPDPVIGMDAVTYVIGVSNAGPGAATNVAVVQSVTSAPSTPPTFQSFSGSGWGCVAGTTEVTCTRPSLASGASAPSLIIQWQVGPAGGTLGAQADVSATEADLDPANSTATASTTVTGVPYTDLSITKTDGQATAVPGQPITYTIVASNVGPGAANGATVADPVPAAITGATWTCVGVGGGTCAASGTGSINATVNLPVSGSVIYTLTGTISSSANGSLSNTATVSAPSGLADPNLANNSATDTDTLVGLDYYTLVPCRVVDTRGGAPFGGPVMQGQQTRIFAVAGHCGIPSTARALTLNVTVTQPSAPGYVRLLPAGQVSTVSTINYRAGQTRANNAVIPLNSSAELAAFVGQPPGTTVHVIIDVSGYFE